MVDFSKINNNDDDDDDLKDFNNLNDNEKFVRLFKHQQETESKLSSIDLNIKNLRDDINLRELDFTNKIIQGVHSVVDSYFKRRNEKIETEIKGTNDKEQKFHISFLVELGFKLLITGSILWSIYCLASEKRINDPSNLFVLIITLVFSTSLIEFKKNKSEKDRS